MQNVLPVESFSNWTLAEFYLLAPSGQRKVFPLLLQNVLTQSTLKGVILQVFNRSEHAKTHQQNNFRLDWLAEG